MLNRHPVLKFLLFHLEQQPNAAVGVANHTSVRLRWIPKVEQALEVLSDVGPCCTCGGQLATGELELRQAAARYGVQCRSVGGVGVWWGGRARP